jgi:hypothetical protein
MVRLDKNRYALRSYEQKVDKSSVHQENVREVVLQLEDGEVEVPTEAGEDRVGNAVGARRPAMVISHGCEIDKKTDHPMVTLAQVRDLSEVHDDDQDAVRSYDNKRTFYLPENEFLAGEHYADLRFLTTVRQDVVDELDRIASMNLEGCQLLHFQLFRFQARKRLPEDWHTWPDEDEETE